MPCIPTLLSRKSKGELAVNRKMIAGFVVLMIVGSSAQAQASMTLASSRPVEPACATTTTTTGDTTSDGAADTAGAPSLASATTTPSTPAATSVTNTPPGETNATSVPSTPPGEATATSASDGLKRRKIEQAERSDDPAQRRLELTRRRVQQVQQRACGGIESAAENAKGSRKRRLERILGFVRDMRPSLFARYR